MGLKLFAAASAQPITVADAKANSRVEDSVEDSLWSLWIDSAVAEAESWTGMAIMDQTWDQLLDEFPPAEIELLKYPVQSITAVTYVDESGAAQTLASSNYTHDPAAFPGFVLPAYAVEWPATRDQANAVTVRMRCGYASAAAVPADIRRWLMGACDFYYQHRGPVLPNGKPVELPRSYMMRLDPYRVFKV